MGQAKARRAGELIIYHHTSTLRTNLIWMSGVVEVEGKSEGAIHPTLGEVKTSGVIRRKMTDFPPLVWFTTKMDVPNCLLKGDIVFIDQSGDIKKQISLTEDISRAISLTRVALGFPASKIPVVPWTQHPGYRSAEGAELNQTALEAGDDPADWYVSEVPVDVMELTEFRYELRDGSSRWMVRHEKYVADIHKMVMLCRTQSGVHIPPSWVGENNLQEYVKLLGNSPGLALPKSQSKIS